MEKVLQWDWERDGEWFDRHGYSVLFYSVLYNDYDIVYGILSNEPRVPNHVRKAKMLSKISKEGFPRLGLTSECSLIHVALMASSPDIIELLLEYKCDPFDLDAAGNDALHFAITFNRKQNLNFWIEIFSDFDLNRRNKYFGAFTLSMACDYGPGRMYVISISSILILEHKHQYIDRFLSFSLSIYPSYPYI